MFVSPPLRSTSHDNHFDGEAQRPGIKLVKLFFGDVWSFGCDEVLGGGASGVAQEVRFSVRDLRHALSSGDDIQVVAEQLITQLLGGAARDLHIVKDERGLTWELTTSELQAMVAR